MIIAILFLGFMALLFLLIGYVFDVRVPKRIASGEINPELEVLRSRIDDKAFPKLGKLSYAFSVFRYR